MLSHNITHVEQKRIVAVTPSDLPSQADDFQLRPQAPQDLSPGPKYTMIMLYPYPENHYRYMCCPDCCSNSGLITSPNPRC